MDIDQLRTFVAVIRHGGFTRAAQALGLSQSTVSGHVKALEDAAGARLLERDRRNYRPTAPGKTVLRYAEHAIAARETLDTELGAHAQGTATTLDIAASSVPADWLLPSAIAALRRDWPGARVRVATLDSAKAAAGVGDGDYDLAFLGSRPSDARIFTREVAQDEIILVGCVTNPLCLADGERKLEGIALVGRTSGSGTYASIASLLARHGSASQSPYVVEVGSTQAVKACVLEGVGLGFLSRRAVESELARNILRPFELEGLPMQRPIYVAYRRGTEPTGTAKALIAAMRSL